MVLFRRRDCAGGGGPEVDVWAPIAAVPMGAATAVDVAGTVVPVVVAGCEVGALVVAPRENSGVDAVVDAAGCEVEVVGLGPKLKPVAGA